MVYWQKRRCGYAQNVNTPAFGIDSAAECLRFRLCSLEAGQCRAKDRARAGIPSFGQVGGIHSCHRRSRPHHGSPETTTPETTVPATEAPAEPDPLYSEEELLKLSNDPITYGPGLAQDGNPAPYAPGAQEA